MGRKECSVKCEVWRNQWEVRSVKCGVWSVKCEVSVWSVKSAVWSVKFQFGVWRKQCEVWSVECEVWSLECEECSVKCGVWSVKTLLRLSLKKSNGCRGKDTVGTGCLWTIGHLCLGNFRRRLARVYVICYLYNIYYIFQNSFNLLPGNDFQKKTQNNIFSYWSSHVATCAYHRSTMIYYCFAILPRAFFPATSTSRACSQSACLWPTEGLPPTQAQTSSWCAEICGRKATQLALAALATL